MRSSQMRSDFMAGTRYAGVFLFLILDQQVEDVLVYRCVLLLDLRAAGGGCVAIQVCSYSWP